MKTITFLSLALCIMTMLLFACTSAIEPTVDPTIETAATNTPAEQSSKEQPIPTAIPVEETTMTILEGSSWNLPNWDSEESTLAPFNDRITIQFADGKIGGSAGCNRYFASYTQGDDGSLTFTPIGSTRRACERALMTAESQFLQALQATTAFTVSEDGSQLILTLGEKGALSFTLNS